MMEEIENSIENPVDIEVNLSDLYVIHESLRWAWRNSQGRDIMSSAARMGETVNSSLTNQLADTIQLVQELIEVAESDARQRDLPSTTEGD